MGKIIKRPAFWIAVAALVAVAALLVTTLFSGRVYITVAELAADKPTLTVPVALDEPVPEGEGFVTAAETDTLRLEWDGERMLFRIVSQTTGTVWESGYGFDVLEDYSKRNRRVMTTLLQINYLDGEGKEGAQNNTVDGVTVTATKLQNGMALHFDYSEPAIKVTMQLWLDEWGLSLRIPEEGIQENGDCKLLSLDVLPAFGSMLTGDDGFILYPDGSGALMECNTPGKTAGVYTKSVYSERYADLQEVADAFSRGETGVTLPYFGTALRGKQGFIAYVENGAENARVSLSVGGESLPLNRMYTTVLYRFSRELTNSQGTSAIAFSATRETLDYRVRYCLLEQEETTYSAMAVTLRRFLQENGTLPTASRVTDTTAVTVEWLVSVRQNDLLSSGNLVMTSFKEVDAALTELETAGVKHTRSLLLGWQKEGYGVYPLSSAVLSSAGGKSGLKSLLATAGEGREFYLETDYVQANSEGSLNKRQDAVTDFMHTVVSDEAATLFLLNPLRQYDRFSRTDLKRYGSLGTTGVAFSSLARFLPADYATSRKATGVDTANAYAAMLRLTREQELKVAVQTGSAYLLPYADYVYDAYDQTSGMHIFTEDIPFYQMLVHGLIAYSGITPGNMSADFTETKLKWADYGCNPYFLLSEESSGMLENAMVTDVFNSRYADWKARVVEVYQEFDQRLKPLYGQQMVEHRRLTEEVACVTYADGSVLLVNYGEEAAETPYGTVPARDYTVTTGGEG
ncbi:MAG: hypothetical protein IJZ13_07755 [Clostridia bacterium]|nr:hypothetical protein [Clostridia bacterium]